MTDKPKHPLIEQAIKDGGGSQAELAKNCGCAQQHISKLLNGEVAISAEMAVAIERATGMPRWRLRPDLWAQPLAAPDPDKRPLVEERAA